MQFFAQSSGSAPHQDYRWYHVSAEGCAAAEPPRLREWSKLLDSDAPSILLVHDAQRWSLFVTNMPSQRTDFQGRPLRNYLFWHTSDHAEEHMLRALAADFLCQSKALYHQVDEQLIISVDNETGFDVNHTDLTQFSKRMAICDALPKPTPCIAHNTAENRQLLAEELRQYALPNQAIVVITDVKSPEKLEEHPFFWRGLTNLEPCRNWRKKNKIKQVLRKWFG